MLPEERTLKVVYEGKSYELDFGKDEGIIIDVKKDEIIKPFSNEKYAYEKCKKVREDYVDATFKFDEIENAIVLDKCDVIVNGKSIGEDYAVFNNEKLYQMLPENKYTSVIARYKLKSDFDGRVCVVVEKSTGLDSVIVNGEKQEFYKSEWFYDKNFKRIFVDIEKGENLIDLAYIMQGNNFDCAGFETENNKFFRETEIENIYVLGYFSVITDNVKEIKRNGKDYFSCEVKGITENISSVYVSTARPFFRGEIKGKCKFKFDGDAKLKTYLSIDNSFPLVEITLNGKVLMPQIADGYVDVTGIIKKGKNKIKLIFKSSDKNLMGPHHYKYCDSEFISPDTFMGKREYSSRFDQMKPYSLMDENIFSDDFYILDENYSGIIKIKQYK